MNFALAIALALAGGPSVQKLDELRTEHRAFLDTLAVIESNNNDDAVGDSGRALGRYQIWRVYWQDSVQYAPDLNGTYEDVKSKEYAERVIMAYLLRYAKQALKDYNYERLARIHNGGPKGYERKITDKYWGRFQRAYLTPPQNKVQWGHLPRHYYDRLTNTTSA